MSATDLIYCFRACLSFPLPVYLNYLLSEAALIMDLLMVQFVHFVVNVPYLFFLFMLVV